MLKDVKDTDKELKQVMTALYAQLAMRKHIIKKNQILRPETIVKFFFLKAC